MPRSRYWLLCFGFTDAVYPTYHPSCCHQSKISDPIPASWRHRHNVEIHSKKASSSLNYQDDVNSSLDRNHDIDATAEDEDEGNEGEDDESGIEVANQVKDAVLKVGHDFMWFFVDLFLCMLFKLRKIVRLVCWTQHCKSWARQIQIANAQNGTLQATLMLILDVITCWSSTHQMLHKSFLSFFMFLLIIFQVTCLTSTLSLTLFLIFTETSGHIHCQTKNGKWLSLLPIGWSLSELLLLKCQQPRLQCFLRCMPFKRIFMTSSVNSRIWFLLA